MRRPSVGLFIDLEVRYVNRPVFVGRSDQLDHQVVGIGQSRRGGPKPRSPMSMTSYFLKRLAILA
ncbi:hypothetical protein [uncultured Ilumatobacter sp.]|uniref:hypothetical protein n=1 Tax=uncultured Ilumatobacter sp. TaxID=879968 RepID=UPI00374F9249